MSTLKSYRLLSFDVYGTLVDWETGVINGLYESLPTLSGSSFTRRQLLEVYSKHEASQQAETPDMLYSELLSTVLAPVAKDLQLPAPTKEQSIEFGASIGKWPAFPDTVDALRRLQQHYKLVVLSNVDRESFSGSNSGPLEGIKFDGIFTAQDIGSYKPDLRNFEYLLQEVEAKFGIKRGEVLQTAQSQFHDHQPARKMGIKSAWIVRSGAVMGNVKDEVEVGWRFDTLGEMADTVEKEALSRN